MENQENSRRIGNATYLVERVYVGEKSPRQVVVEEIITAASRALDFDRSADNMV